MAWIEPRKRHHESPATRFARDVLALAARLDAAEAQRDEALRALAVAYDARENHDALAEAVIEAARVTLAYESRPSAKDLSDLRAALSRLRARSAP